jgi:hypothetical protein
MMAAAAAPRRVALVITEYRRNAHADVIGTRMLEGYHYHGKHVAPRVRVASIYTDQTPWNDMSRDMARKHRVPVFDTVRDAVTMGTGKLDVDGVVVIGEHGNYPYNEKLQHLYPRHELVSQVADVFRDARRSVPVFCDKHLSTDWWKAKQMYDWSRQLKFPFMAGSSIPVTWRRPGLELALGSRVRHAVSAGGGATESYGFHALEGLQCMVERRRGGETGVRSVQALEGADVWKWTDANPWVGPLLDAACSRSQTRQPGDVRTNCRAPVVFVAEYSDGLVGATYMLNGHINDFNFAAAVEGRAEPASTCFWLQNERFYGHFSSLTHYIEELVLTAREPYPVERTLLTTGVLAAAMESAWRGHARIETPHLAVKYTAGARSLYNTGPVPPGEGAA